eukprot:123363-Amphidinium_carterae.1
MSREGMCVFCNARCACTDFAQSSREADHSTLFGCLAWSCDGRVGSWEGQNERDSDEGKEVVPGGWAQRRRD